MVRELSSLSYVLKKAPPGSSEDPLLASRINTLGNDGHVLHILLRGVLLQPSQ